MAKVISIRTTPIQNTELSEKLTGPSEPWNAVHVRMAGVAPAVKAVMASAAVAPALAARYCATSGEASVKRGMGASAFRMYAAAIEQPSDSTGVHASQLHQTESGAMNFE